MRTQWVRLCAAITVSASAMLAANLAYAQTCSFAAVNGSCALTIDRLHPVAPPTIYLRRGSHVTVLVSHPLPFEHLTLEQKIATEQLPADQLRNGFADITAGLGTLVFTNAPGAVAPLEAPLFKANPVQPPPCPDLGSTDADKFKNRQCKLANEMKTRMAVRKITDPPDPTDPNPNFGTWVYSRLCSIRNLFMPLQSSELTPDSPPTVCRDLPQDITVLKVPMDVSEMEAWKSSFAVHSGVVKDMNDFLEST